MPSWLLKAGVQGAISLLPGRHRLNALLQQHVTGSLTLTEDVFETKVAHCSHHLARLRDVRGWEGPPGAVLELGTGWYPIVPIGLALAGADEVTTLDVSPLADADRTRQTLELYAAWLESGRLATALPGIDAARAEKALSAARTASAASAIDLLARVGVRAMVGDARATRLPDGAIELIVSNNTFEHIPAAVLQAIMAELRRVAAPPAVMDHFVDISDHYAHFDRSISEFNYLRYSPRVWRVFNNRLQFQSRLRAPDYRRLVENAGFTMVAEEAERGAPEELAAITLAPHFHHYAREDLLVLRTWITAVA
ncbi:MAG: class I SAM-dependent methyltransferase [Solirubrobacteraceae bacterium]